MIAITTSSSTSVKPRRHRDAPIRFRQFIFVFLLPNKGTRDHGVTPAGECRSFTERYREPTLRSGFVTHLLNKNVPIHEVQLLARHENMSTTGVYARADPRRAIEQARDVF